MPLRKENLHDFGGSVRLGAWYNYILIPFASPSLVLLVLTVLFHLFLGGGQEGREIIS